MKKSNNNLLYLVSIILFTVSCSPLKTKKMNKSTGGLYETFYVGKEGTQYFIKELEFKSKTNEMLAIDFTFRYNHNKTSNQENSVIANYTFSNHRNIKIDSFLVGNKLRKKIQRTIFKEKEKNKILTRQSVEISLGSLCDVLSQNNLEVILKGDNEILSFKPKKNTTKKVLSLQNNLWCK